jgi:hypothetical protein
VAYDEALADRIRELVAGERNLSEKKMFGGLAFLINGNMSVGVLGEELIVRVDPTQADAALKEPGARPFDMTGRPMKGWVMVGGAGIKDEPALAKWTGRGVAYASSLPKK